MRDARVTISEAEETSTTARTPSAGVEAATPAIVAGQRSALSSGVGIRIAGGRMQTAKPRDARQAASLRGAVRCLIVVTICAVVLAALGCSARPASEAGDRAAGSVVGLFTWMSLGATIVWALVVVLALRLPRSHWLATERGGTALIVVGCAVVPTAILGAVIGLGLPDLPALLSPGRSNEVSIDVSASQWWWRVRYSMPDGPPIELANEIRLPIGQRVDTRLVSADVVHSFWIPSLTDKTEMIPGRTNRLALEPTRAGIFRGACAEFCGTAHARMNFPVVVMEASAFAAWLAEQREPALPAATPLAARGQAAFMQRGCNVCHTVRGTAAAGVNGPDLTHVSSRLTLAAGTLTRNPKNLRLWIAATRHLKPDVHMPAFATLPPATLDALVAYLLHLQ
jgi:cytochrome c oxidase subunit 2